MSEEDNKDFKESENDESNDNCEETDLSKLEKYLTDQNPEVFKNIPDKQKKELLKSFSFTLIKQSLHSGPIPSPDSLGKYNSIIPNGADRIMKMAERQQEHRMKIEDKVITSQSKQSILGQIFGLFIGVLGIAGGVILGIYGNPYVGGVIGGGTVVSLVTVFVLGKKYQKKNTEE